MKTKKKKVNILGFGDYLNKMTGALAASTIGGITSLAGSGVANLTTPLLSLPNMDAGSTEELMSLYGQATPQIDKINTGKSALSGVAQGASAGATFGPWGAAIGGAVGGLSNLTTSILGNKKIQDRNELLLQLKMGNLDASRQSLENKNFYNQMSTAFADGGNLFAKGGGIHIKPENRGKFTATKKATGKSTEELTHSKNPLTRKRAIFAQNAKHFKHLDGGDLQLEDNVFAKGGDLQEQELNGINTFATGGTHENNINGGIPQGVDNEGIPNLVEQGEVKYNNYIFSNRLKVDKKNTFADMAKKYSRESKERPNDPISKRGLDVKMNALKGIQELMKGPDELSGNPQDVNIGAKGIKLREPSKLLFNEPLMATTPINKGFEAMPSALAPTKLPYNIPVNETVSPVQQGIGLSDLRYVPAVASGIATLSDTLGLTNRPDYTASKQIGSMSVKPKTLGNYMTYTPFDKNYYTNQLLSSAAAARTGLRESSGGNRATYQAGLLGADYNLGRSLGLLARESEHENIQRRQSAMAYNQGIDQYNAQQSMLAQQLNNQYRTQAAQLGEQARMQSNQAKMLNLNNFLLSLGDIGSEEVMRNVISSNKFLKYISDRGGTSTYKGNTQKCGGKLKLK